ncbi:hypothetical protein [Thalassolituus pacificus]|uniref:DUF4412 domain-containing protein n=1 Tax=Thalassolituus pacificus TaxID=2975440 RepID=A0A9X2WG06_9GAMM|nr:hypothetical protein [Thalassolituus pacificus]MCT7359052.1 hypothetical protein [Thalassolituus pacificus]
MLKTLSVITLFLLATFRAQAVEVVDYPVYLGGAQSLKAIILPLKNEEKALIQVSGVNHAVDRVVFLAEMQNRGQGGVAYRIAYDGQMKTLILKGVNWGNEYFQVFLPDNGRDGLNVGTIEQGETDPTREGIVQRYTQQTTEGIQKKLALFNRDKHVKNVEAMLSEKDSEASKACGGTVKTAIDWASVNDDLLKGISIGAYCGQVAGEMARICGRYSEFKADLAALQGVQCQFSDKLKLRRKGNNLTFMTEKDAPNQSDFINAYLRNF